MSVIVEKAKFIVLIIIFYISSDSFVCGPCSIKENIPCSSPPVKIFYENKSSSNPDQHDSFKCKALIARVQQSLKRNEILNYPLSGEGDLIKFLRFKFGFCDLEAGNILEQMKLFNMVSLNRDNSISLNMKGLQIWEGKDWHSLNTGKIWFL